MKYSTPHPRTLTHPIIPYEPMRYKEVMKQNELVTKLRIIRLVKKDNIPAVQVAQAFHCHRNTIGNIITAFEETYTADKKEKILERKLTQEQVEDLLAPMKNRSTKPDSHPLQATQKQEQTVHELFYDKHIRVGPRRMYTHIHRTYGGQDKLHPVTKLSIGQIKGIYKRHGMQVKRVRTKNYETRALYDYRALACFEKMHIDVKHVADQKSLPENIYQLFIQNRQIPRYQWTIIDARSRYRFLAWSYELTSEFGFCFLLIVIQYIRAKLSNYDTHIAIGIDNGTEFCGGSERKEAEWNRYLSLMNASMYQYIPGHDVRKNLIERSHRTDDEELYIPRGTYMNTKETFMKETADYTYYYNSKRHHSGHAMDDRTPFEVLTASGLPGTQAFLSFPTLLLDDWINQIRACINVLEFELSCLDHPTILRSAVNDPKIFRDLESRFPFFRDHAQNVLTYYPIWYTCSMKKGPFFLLSILVIVLIFILGVQYGKRVEVTDHAIQELLKRVPSPTVTPTKKLEQITYKKLESKRCGFSFVYPSTYDIEVVSTYSAELKEDSRVILSFSCDPKLNLGYPENEKYTSSSASLAEAPSIEYLSNIDHWREIHVSHPTRDTAMSIGFSDEVRHLIKESFSFIE